VVAVTGNTRARIWLGALGASLLAVVAFAVSPSHALAACSSSNAQPASVSTKVASKAIVCLLNAERARHGMGNVRPKNSLNAAAQEHSRYMIEHGCFDHVCSGEAGIVQRLGDYLFGASAWMYGENIAWGEQRIGTPKAIVSAWMRSPEHRANILNPRFDQIGVGIVWGSPVASRVPAGTYTTDFGYAAH
jgi:uncharacterized protein YkwD